MSWWRGDGGGIVGNEGWENPGAFLGEAFRGEGGGCHGDCCDDGDITGDGPPAFIMTVAGICCCPSFGNVLMFVD